MNTFTLASSLVLILFVSAVSSGQEVVSITPGSGSFGTEMVVEVSGDLGPKKPRAFLERVGDGKRFKLKVFAYDQQAGTLDLRVGKKKSMSAGTYRLVLRPKGKPKPPEIVTEDAFELLPPTVLGVTPDSASPGDEVTLQVADLGTRKFPVRVSGKKAKAKAWDPVAGTLVLRLPKKKLHLGPASILLKSPLGDVTFEGLTIVQGADGGGNPGPPGGQPLGLERISLAFAQSGPRWIFADDGGVLLQMRLASGGLSGNTVLMRFAPDGAIAWQREFVGAHSFLRATDGNLWFSNSDGQVGKLDPGDGSVLWAFGYGAALHPDVDVTTDRDWAELPLAYPKSGVVQADGSVSWQTDANRLAPPTKLADGGWLVHGQVHGQLEDIFLPVAVVRPDGAPQFSIYLYRDGHEFEDVHAYECDDGDIAVFAVFESSLWFGRLDDAGQLVSEESYAAPDVDSFRVVEDGAGGYFFVATGFLSDVWVVHADSTGDLSWVRQVSSPSQIWVQGLAPRSGGGVFVAGNRGSAGDLWAIALGADGELDWERIPGVVRGEVRHVSTGPAGRLRIAVSTVVQGDDAWMLAFDDDGSLAAQATFYDIGDGGLSFSATPDGRVVGRGFEVVSSFQPLVVAMTASGEISAWKFPGPSLTRFVEHVSSRAPDELRVAMLDGLAYEVIVTTLSSETSDGPCGSQVAWSGSAVTNQAGVSTVSPGLPTGGVEVQVWEDLAGLIQEADAPLEVGPSVFPAMGLLETVCSP